MIIKANMRFPSSFDVCKVPSAILIWRAQDRVERPSDDLSRVSQSELTLEVQSIAVSAARYAHCYVGLASKL